MIRFLSIRDLAVIERTDLELPPGFTVLTGETGAGKSIVLGALDLLAGSRAGGDRVRTGTGKAVVQAVADNGDGTESVLRRELHAEGRSRSFRDDTLITLTELRNAGRRLIDFHGQHAHQALLDPRNHLALLDAHGKLQSQAAAVAAAHGTWRDAAARLQRAQADRQQHAERADLLAFQQREIDDVAPEAGEDVALGAERKRLANAERFVALCRAAYGALYEDDGAALPTLGQVWRQVAELADIDESFAAHLAARSTVEAQLEDLAFALRAGASDTEDSPQRLAAVEERLAALERLKRKYGPSLDDVLARRQEIGAGLDALRAGVERIEQEEQAEQQAGERFLTAARALSARRQATAETMASELALVLAELAMPHARLRARFTTAAEQPARWSPRGIDDVELYFSANPGEAPRPLARIASGGELSRVMLALKTLATTDTPGKTLVFDEIDAGIGGSAASRVGQLLSRLGERFQVLCVSHLPQIAACATTHFHVAKVVQAGRTATSVTMLDQQARVSELARLMTGGVSDEALAGARELLAGQRGAGAATDTPAGAGA